MDRKDEEHDIERDDDPGDDGRDDEGREPESDDGSDREQVEALAEGEELTPAKLENIAWEAANTAKEILAHFPSVPNAEVTSKVEDGSIWVDIQGDTTGRLIGRKGKTIEAFQHVLSKIMSHRLRRKITIHVDAEGYRARTRDKLLKLAQQTADYVAATGSARALEPMSASDRRTIHMALKDRTDVITASEGQDDNRFVVIWPREDEE